MFKYLHYPIRQKDIEIKQGIMYQAFEEKRQNFKKEDFCADVFLCDFLYNDSQFEEIMESVYSEEEKTYDFITLSNITHIKIETLRLRASRLGLIKKTI